MHEKLKGTRLRCVRRWWMLPADTTDVLADPALTVTEHDELTRELEAGLCTEYVRWLAPHPVVREQPLAGRYADIYDTGRRLIIEAKISNDDLVVLSAAAQAMHYRMLANRDEHRIDNVAILLPHPPTELARATLRQNGLDDVGFIWRDGNMFREQLP